jgi:organic hydroperoxide reductase OsmC/OhrA
MKESRVLYTGKAHTSGGRDGASHSSDGRLDIKLSTPAMPAISLPGVEREVAQALLAAEHQTCPYSTRPHGERRCRSQPGVSQINRRTDTFAQPSRRR